MESDTINGEWLEGTYYDGDTGDFVQFESDGAEIREVAVFDGATIYTFSREEFVEAKDEFLQIDDAVVDDPAEFLREFLSGVVDYPRTSVSQYDEFEIEYARNAVQFVNRDI